MPFHDDARPTCAPDVLSRVLDGEAVLLDLASGTYFGLNPVGSRIWELIAAGKSVGEMRATLVAEFDTSDDAVAVDLEQLLTRLLERGLIRLEGASGARP